MRGGKIFSRSLLRALQELIEKRSYMQQIPYTLALFSAQEFLKILKNSLRSEFLFDNLVICCVTEKFGNLKGSCNVGMIAACGFLCKEY